MLTREQVYTMLILRNREYNIFSVLPDELICHISDINDNPDSDINIALRHAAKGTKEDIAIVVEMVKKDPGLLLQAGHVRTRGGVPIIRLPYMNFFLGKATQLPQNRLNSVLQKYQMAKINVYVNMNDTDHT